MRREHDSLGDKEVPSEALYGIQTQRAIENFPISGLPPRPELVDGIVLVKKAAALVNRELGLLPADKAEAIVRAADEVLGGAHRDQFRVDPFQAGAGTSHNMNANEVLANRANELLGGGPRGVYAPVHPNDDVNKGQSSNDAIPTAIRLALQRPAGELAGALLALQRALEAKAAEFDHVLKSARTHLQDAVPIRLGQEFAAYAVTVRKARERVVDALEETRALHIGGTAAGTGLNADPRYAGLMVARLSELAGMPLRAADDLVQATQSLDDFVAFSARAAGRGAEPDPARQRPAAAVERPAHRPCRDHAAGRAAGLVDHARQGQPGDGGDARHGLLPRRGRRRGGGPRRPGGAARDQRHDAARRL